MPDDYKKDLEIDKHDLDGAWLSQPSLFAKWGENHAQAIFERDRAKENLDVVRAELDAAVRAHPQRYGWSDDKKPTESFISNTILTQEKYKKANLALAEATKNVNILGVAREAFGAHRKEALGFITRLHLANYFSEPDIPHETKEAQEERSGARHREALKGSGTLGKLKERRAKRDAERDKG